MELPASLREINPVIDEIARGEPAPEGALLRLAVALGLATSDGSLTEAGRAYARPALAAGPVSLVMGPERRTVAWPLLTGPLPLQRALYRLLEQIARQGDSLVNPALLGWPEPVLRPYLTYLEDLGLLIPIGPMVELSHAGRALLGAPAPPTGQVWPDLPAEFAAEAGLGPPTFQSPVFRYHLVRQICLTLLTLRGKREWHLLQPLLDGPFFSLKPAYQEWLARFQATQPAIRRSWSPELVERFAALRPAPPWFGHWCQTLVGTGPEGAAEALTHSPGLFREPAILRDGAPDRATWLVAVAVHWATRRGSGLRYPEAVACLERDGLVLPSPPDMHAALESAGLLVTAAPDLRLLLPVGVHPPAEVLWPYAGPEWVAAALLEAGAFAPVHAARRTVRV